MIVTITAYNKTVIAGGFGGTLAGADPAYLVKRGYAQLTVDARGTGSSEGQWNAFDKREDQDGAEVMTWAHQQPWSNGNTAMTGASYMGISQIFAAAGRAGRAEGDLPAGAGGRRLPRRGRLRRPDRLRLHAAVARPGHGDQPDPAGRRGHRPAVRDRRARLAHRRGRHLHRPHAGQGAGRPGHGVRRPVLRRALPDQRDLQGQRADVPDRRRVRPLPARHPAALREPPQARRPDQADHRPVGPPQGLVGRRGRQRRLRPAQRAAAALVRPLRQGHARQDPRLRHRADDLLRAGHRRLDEDEQLGRQRPGRLDLEAVGQRQQRHRRAA